MRNWWSVAPFRADQKPSMGTQRGGLRVGSREIAGFCWAADARYSMEFVAVLYTGLPRQTDVDVAAQQYCRSAPSGRYRPVHRNSARGSHIVCDTDRHGGSHAAGVRSMFHFGSSCDAGERATSPRLSVTWTGAPPNWPALFTARSSGAYRPPARRRRR